MSANRALSGPSALKSRRTRSGAALACGAAAFLSPLGRLAHPRVVPVQPFSAHQARHALARGAHTGAPQLGEDLRSAVDAAAGGVYLGDLRRQLGVAPVARAGRPSSPRVVSLPGDLERGAHLRDRPCALVEHDESELGPLRLRAYSCLLAKKALAFKSISFSRLSRSTSRRSLRFSSATLKGLSSGDACAASALLTQSDMLPASQPSSLAISA